MTDPGTALETQLEALVVGDPDFDELCRIEDHFCPFEAIGMVGQEVRHAQFLSYCLDPQRPHGFGNAAFRALLRAATREGSSVARGARSPVGSLDAHLMEFPDLEVRREWRRIDLLCIAAQERLIVAIELKIDAREHGAQLTRYRKIVEANWPSANGWKHILLLLSKNGDEPTETNGKDWVGVELGLLAAELELLCTKQIGRAETRSLLQSYLSMLRKHHLVNQRLVEIAEKLWGRHREALSFLMDNQPEYGVFGELRNNVSEVLDRIRKSSGLQVECDKDTANLIFISVPKWRSLPEFETARNWTKSKSVVLILLERIRGGTGVKIWLEVGPSTPEIRQAYYDRITEAIPDMKLKKTISEKFTRVGSASYTPEDTCDDPLEWTLGEIESWSRQRLPAIDRALEGQRAGSQARGLDVLSG